MPKNSGTSNRTDDQSSGVNEVLEAGMAEEDNSAQEAELPAESEEACVVGVFDTYKEGSNTYATLRNAQLSQ
jgi:hypothetical protein